MNCRRTRAIIDRDEEASLSPAAQNDFAAHLASCPACRREQEAALSLSALLRSRAPASPPPGYWDSFWPRVSARLSAGAAPAPRRAFRNPFAFRWSGALALAAAAALAFVVVGGYLVIERRGGPASPPLAPSAAEGVDYVIARAESPLPAPETHYVLARGRVASAVPAAISRPSPRSSPGRLGFAPAPSFPSDHFILTSGGRGGAQPQIYW